MTDTIRLLSDPTKTSLFLVPVLGFRLHKMKESGFINGYSFIKDPDIKNMLDCLYLLFKPVNQARLGELIEDNVEKIINELDYAGGYTVLVCPFPVKYINDKNLFWEGKYSKLSSNFRSNFNNIDHKHALAIMNKNKKLKEGLEERIGMLLPHDSEISSSPIESNETLDISLFLNE